MEFLALPILIFFVYAVYKFATKPHLAVAGILLISVINAWFIEPPSVKVGLNIYLHDLVFVPLFLSALVRLIFKRQWHYASPLWAGYGLIIFYSLYVGLKQYGTAAGVDFRNFFYYWSGALYFMSFVYSKEMIDRIVKYWILICTSLLVIVYFRFVAESLHLPISATWRAADAGDIPFRVINSGAAYLLGVAVALLFYRYVIADKEKPSRILTVLFLMAIIALQHRSVWAMTLVTISSIFILPGIKKHKIFSKLTIIGAVGLVLLIPFLLSDFANNFFDSITESAERATNLSTGTFGARRKGWAMVMDYWVNQDYINQFLGDPFGGGYGGSPRAPHNFFFQSLLRTGILGNILLLSLYLGILVKLYFRILKDTVNRLYPTLFFMLIVGQITYYIPYSPQAEHGILLGIAASLAKRRMSVEGSAESQNTQYFLNTPKR